MTFLFIAIFEDSPSAAPQAEAVAAPLAQAPQAATAPISNPQPTSSPDVDMAGEPQDGNEPVSGSSAAKSKPLSKADQIRLLRPNCLNVEVCAGSGRQHCHTCTKAMGEAAA